VCGSVLQCVTVCCSVLQRVQRLFEFFNVNQSLFYSVGNTFLKRELIYKKSPGLPMMLQYVVDYVAVCCSIHVSL